MLRVVINLEDIHSGEILGCFVVEQDHLSEWEAREVTAFDLNKNPVSKPIDSNMGLAEAMSVVGVELENYID